MRLFGPPAAETGAFELGRFLLGPGDNDGCWSRDGDALLVPKLRVTSHLVRRVANHDTLFRVLNGVQLMNVDAMRFETSMWSYIWGDLDVFRNGEPTITRAILVRGKIDMPDPTNLGRYLAEMPKLVPAVL